MISMTTREREPKSITDFYNDLFVGGYFDPKEFLENHWNVRKINECVAVLKEYKKTLEENNLIEEI